MGREKYLFWPYFICDDYGTSNWKYLTVKVKAMRLRIPWTEVKKQQPKKKKKAKRNQREHLEKCENKKQKRRR